MLTRAQQTYTILSNGVAGDVKKSIGCVALRSENFFRIFPITRSMWIRTLAIFLVSSTSLPESWVSSTSIPESWLLPLVKAGILRVEQYEPTESLISNPLSARTVSPGTRLLSREQCSVMYLSLVLPPHPSDM